MSIGKVESITINGSQNFLGGQIYDLKFTRGFNGQPSTIECKIIAESKSYQTPDLSYTSPYHIALGDVYQFDFFAYKYCISDGTQGRIMTVYFKDGVNKFSRYWIAPIGQVCAHPNVIFVGTIPNGSGFGSVNQAQGVVQNQSFHITPTQTFLLPGEKSVPFGSYNYEEFQKGVSFLGIPLIPSNNFVRITQEGTVLDVFNYFMNLYGYTWYLDAGAIVLIDLKRPVVLDSNLLATLDTHPKRLSSNTCVGIDNNFVRGAVGLDDGANTNANDPNAGSYILSAAQSIWDGTNIQSSSLGFSLDNQQSNVNFLGIPLLAGYGPQAALYASHSPELYFAYIYSKFGLQAAMQAMGFYVYETFNLDEVPSDTLKTNQFGDSSSPYTADNAHDVMIMACTSVSQDGIQSFYERDKLLGDVLLKGYYSIQDINASVQWAEGSPSALNSSTKFSEISEFHGLIFDNSLITDVTTQNVWILSFPLTLEEQFSTLLNSTFLEQLANLFPQKFLFPAKSLSSIGQFDDAKYFMIRVDTNNIQSIVGNFPVLRYPGSSIRYVRGNLNSADIRLGNVTQKDVPIYGLGGRTIVACNIPPVFPETSNLEIVTFENIKDEVPNVKKFIAQNAYSKNNPDVQYEVNIRGISLGFIITPQQGLENINVSLDENGYTSSYQLSSRRELPPKPEAFKGLKQFSPLT